MEVRNWRLDEEVALVTGGASGIGRATATMLADFGATVAVLDKDVAGARATTKEIAASGGRSVAIAVDLAAGAGEIDRAVEDASEVGAIRVLVNCAGVTARRDGVFTLDEMEWDLLHAVNLKAQWLMSRTVAQRMVRDKGGGRIVNVTSSSAFRASRTGLAYGSSKSGVVQLTRTLAAQLAEYNINVNAVAPGPTQTAMTGTPEKLLQTVRQGPLANLFGRISEPEDVAAAIVFLCLPASRQVTAQVIHVSAGAVVLAMRVSILAIPSAWRDAVRVLAIAPDSRLSGHTDEDHHLGLEVRSAFLVVVYNRR